MMFGSCKIGLQLSHKSTQWLFISHRQVKENDIIMPEKARAVARDLGIPYYETSVLTFYGIDELFENAIRAALCSRRSQRFWMTGLKKVMQPALQVLMANIMCSKSHLHNSYIQTIFPHNCDLRHIALWGPLNGHTD